jgi:hypothetical protein
MRQILDHGLLRKHAVQHHVCLDAPISTLVRRGPGGQSAGADRYRFGDYWRMGLPLEILIVAVAIPTILVVWPL